jgi:putative cell wall-binding protein
MLKKSLMFAIFVILLVPFLPSDTAVSAASTNSIIYSGTLPSNQVHTYRFTTTKEGYVNVDYLSTGTTLHSIIEVESGEPYSDGDYLPVGVYDLSLSPADNTTVDYRVDLNGDLGMSGETTLPNLSVTSPASNYTRLDKDVTNINFAGTSNGDIFNYILNHQSPVSLASSFSKNLNVLFGPNVINTNAELSNHNKISDVREVVSTGVKRISGTSRYDTAVETSKEIEKEGYVIDTVILAAGDSHLDAVPGIVLAYNKNAPILLTNRAALPSATKNEITRLNAKNVIILGATGAVSTDVENELKSLGLNVSRIQGNTRYETAIEIANEVITPYTDRVIIVKESAWVDALAIAPYAANTQTPILYTDANSVPSELQQFLDHRGIDQYILIGGTSSISQEVENIIKKDGPTYRIDGATKYDTPVNIPKALDFRQNRFVLFSNNIDGISAALLGSYKKANLLLTNRDSLPTVTGQYLQGYANDRLLENVYLMGGTNVIPTSSETYINGLFN